MAGTICFIRKRDEKCFDQSCFIFLYLLQQVWKHRTEGDVVPACSTTKLTGSISKFGWFGVLFCYFVFLPLSIKYYLWPQCVFILNTILLNLMAYITLGSYMVLKVPQAMQNPPTNNNRIILRGPLGLLPLSISKLRHKHTKKVLPKGLWTLQVELQLQLTRHFSPVHYPGGFTLQVGSQKVILQTTDFHSFY